MAIGIANCTCSACGTQFQRRAKKYNCTEAESWVKWAEANITLCPECWKKEQEEKAAAALRRSAEGITLAELEGSPKQIAWAEDIRSKFALKSADNMGIIDRADIRDKYTRLRTKTLEEMKSARWWIDNRVQLTSGVIIIADDEQ